MHLGGRLGLEADFGRKLRAHKVTSAGLDDYVTNVVTAFLDERRDGEPSPTGSAGPTRRRCAASAPLAGVLS